MTDITAIILTRDEERHIARCIESLAPCVSRICVVDSGSTDRTVEIARQKGAETFYHKWVRYADQFTWALQHCDIRSGWILRIDADEILSPRLQQEIAGGLSALPEDVSGVVMHRTTVFMGRPIRHGFFRQKALRLWRRGAGAIEARWMDEHITLSRGRNVMFRGELLDHNLNDLSWWTAKHDRYATREALDLALRTPPPQGLKGEAARKRVLKTGVYARLPRRLRPALYFFYRYVIGLGFLDGREGFYFHVLQAFWYRTLVEAKLVEAAQRADAGGESLEAVLEADIKGPPSN